MIVTRLMGGLGNQMFQYAAGWSLARRLDTELLIDRTWLEGEGLFATPRHYELDAFRLQARSASPKLVSKLERRREICSTACAGRLGLARTVTVLHERSHAFDTRFETVTGDVLLVGYWQSEKYFADCAEAIRAEFELKDDAFAAQAAN